jgi:twinkle protein
MPGGEATGWPGVDKLFTVRPGELTVLTGIPGHGKSEWLDALLCNLFMEHGWRFGICSPENHPVYRHVIKLLEKLSGMPFGDGPRPRLNWESASTWTRALNDNFFFFDPGDDMFNVESILSTAKELVFRHGIKVLVLDPWNELDHERPKTLTETEYVSMALGKIRRFARHYGVHVFVVAHPTKLKKDEDGKQPVPSLYDIAGSANWYNKADNGIVVWRNVMNSGDRLVKIYIVKIRFKEIGERGSIDLEYDVVTGRYSEFERPSFLGNGNYGGGRGSYEDDDYGDRL